MPTIVVAEAPSIVEAIAPRLITAIIGVVTGFLGAAITAAINNKMQFFGRIRMYSTLEEALPSEGSAKQYWMKCICYHSKSMPVYLDGFCVEMKVKGRKKPVVITAMKTARAEHTEHAVVAGAYIPIKPQIIQPKAMHEFNFCLDINHEAVACYPLRLVAYDEKRKRKIFNLRRGVNLRKEKGESRKHYESVMNDWLSEN